MGEKRRSKKEGAEKEQRGSLVRVQLRWI